METGKAHGLIDVSLEMISGCWEEGIQVMVELCHRVLHGFGMPAEWTLEIVVSIFKVKVDIRNCSCCAAVKLLEHEMKVMEMVLDKCFVE